MRPRTIGRVLGVGVRVAGRVVGQRLAQTQTTMREPQIRSARTEAGPAVSALGQTVGQVAARTQRGISQGAGGFLRPFRRVGGILWLEVTGVFFLLPVIVFAPALWRGGLAYSHTSDHRSFWVTAFVVAVFLYLGVSSFWRARRR